jgi:hypothetical protein
MVVLVLQYTNKALINYMFKGHLHNLIMYAAMYWCLGS